MRRPIFRGITANKKLREISTRIKLLFDAVFCATGETIKKVDFIGMRGGRREIW
jgi:hypothetical protein